MNSLLFIMVPNSRAFGTPLIISVLKYSYEIRSVEDIHTLLIC